MKIADIVEEFGDYVAAQSTAIADGDAAMGNRFAQRYTAAFRNLRAHGDAGRDALAALLTDRRTDVRVMAAAFLLRHCGSRALDVLKEAAKEKGFVAFGAAQVLKRWEEGTWQLDPRE